MSRSHAVSSRSEFLDGAETHVCQTARVNATAQGMRASRANGLTSTRIPPSSSSMSFGVVVMLPPSMLWVRHARRTAFIIALPVARLRFPLGRAFAQRLAPHERKTTDAGCSLAAGGESEARQVLRRSLARPCLGGGRSGQAVAAISDAMMNAVGGAGASQTGEATTRGNREQCKGTKVALRSLRPACRVGGRRKGRQISPARGSLLSRSSSLNPPGFSSEEIQLLTSRFHQPTRDRSHNPKRGNAKEHRGSHSPHPIHETQRDESSGNQKAGECHPADQICGALVHGVRRPEAHEPRLGRLKLGRNI